ncbi:MAG: beta-lactamase family protein [Burkholderiales bacterium]|nr:beta-lactamase family protein [Burkholderiales bacterium]
MNSPELLSLPLPRAEPRALGFAPDRLPRIAAALNAEIARDALPGAVLMIARGGRLGYCETFGHLDPAARTAMPVDAMFSIASMTKPLVTAGALMLCEEGRMAVNQPVSHYLPQLAGMRVNPPQCDGAAGAPTEALLREMTIEDLMRHTAGLSYGRGDKALYARYPFSSDVASTKWTGAEFLAQLASLPLHYQPGSMWEYSLGLDVLGLAIEAVTGRPLAQYLEDRLFVPLRMQDTAFTVPPAQVPRYAKALPRDPVTGAPQILRDGTTPHKFDCGGGCAVSTAADYLRFAQMLLNGGELDGVRVLSRKTVEFMTTDHLGPEVDLSKLNDYPNIRGFGFGLGVAVRRSAGRGGMPGSSGDYHWAGSTGTYFWVDPAEELVTVFMAHAPGAIRYYHRQLLHALVLQALD